MNTSISLPRTALPCRNLTHVLAGRGRDDRPGILCAPKGTIKALAEQEDDQAQMIKEHALTTESGPTQSAEAGLTTGQLMKKVGLTRSRIRRWVASGYLQPVYEWHGDQEWAAFPPDEVDRARRLLWLVDDCGVLPSRAVERLPDVERMEAKRSSAQCTGSTQKR